MNTPVTVRDIKAASIKTLFLIDEYPTRQHDDRIAGKKDSMSVCKICEREGRFETDNVIHALEFCSINERPELRRLWDDILKTAASALDTCPAKLSSYFRRNPSAQATFLLNPEHSTLPPSLSIGQHSAPPRLLNLLSEYCYQVHIFRMLARPDFSDNHRYGASSKDLHPPSNRPPRKPHAGGPSANRTSQGRLQGNNTITRYCV